MSKFYTLILCVLSIPAFAQTRYWVGLSNSNWNNTANWSTASGGAGGASVPNAATYDVVFDQDGAVNLDIASLTLNSIKITNSRTVTLYVTAATTLTVNSGTVGTEGLSLGAGSSLKDSTTSNFDFAFQFAASSKGVIGGDWILTSNPALNGGAYFLADQSGSSVNVNNAARVIFRNKGAGDGTPSSLFFNSGSTMLFARDGGQAPSATYDLNSTIRITGNTLNATSLFNAAPINAGNVEYDCPGLLNDAAITLADMSTVKGNLRILNTNNFEILIAFLRFGSTSYYAQVNGNLEISGSSKVSLANTSSYASVLEVFGNYIQSAGIFSLQSTPTTSNPSTLQLRGNFSQTAGTFTALSAATNNASNLFVLEMKGTIAQTISASSGSIDNANNQVALRINNATGITLNTPLAAGRVDLSSGKLITTNTNLFTIDNPNNNPIDVVGVSNTSYVEGPVKRKTALAAAYSFPVGRGGKYRYCEVIPSSTSASEYTAAYFNSGYGNYTTSLPLTGVSTSEYWDISRVTGSSASVRLNLNGTAVPGAGAGDAVVVAHFDGTSWISQKGTTGTKITPGNATTGTTTSQDLATFSPFTFGYGPSAALPIKLQYFLAEKGNGFNALRWKADCYSTQAVFEIERSYDGQRFDRIERITADQVRCLQPFDYKDAVSVQGTVYYRIRIVDVDGSSFFSRIVAIVNSNKGFEIVSIYPTIVTSGQIRLNIASSGSNKAAFFITNISGQVIRRFEVNFGAGESLIPVDVHGLPTGNYQLTGYNGDGQVRTFRFSKQ